LVEDRGQRRGGGVALQRLVERPDGALGAGVVGGEILGQILRQQGDAGLEREEVVEETFARGLVDRDRVGGLPAAVGLGEEDEPVAVGAAADDTAGALAGDPEEVVAVALDLGDGLAVLGGVVGRLERAGLLPLDDEAVVDGVGPAGTAQRDLGVRHKFDSAALGEREKVGFDGVTEGLFQNAGQGGALENGSEFSGLVAHCGEGNWGRVWFKPGFKSIMDAPRFP
jgi:hypothetical protein